MNKKETANTLRRCAEILHARSEDETVRENVGTMCAELGRETVREAIAAAVKSNNDDGRISARNKADAAAIATCNECGEYIPAADPGTIHPAHLDQIASVILTAPTESDENAHTYTTTNGLKLLTEWKDFEKQARRARIAIYAIFGHNPDAHGFTVYRRTTSAELADELAYTSTSAFAALWNASNQITREKDGATFRAIALTTDGDPVSVWTAHTADRDELGELYELETPDARKLRSVSDQIETHNSNEREKANTLAAIVPLLAEFDGKRIGEKTAEKINVKLRAASFVAYIRGDVFHCSRLDSDGCAQSWQWLELYAAGLTDERGTFCFAALQAAAAEYKPAIITQTAAEIIATAQAIDDVNDRARALWCSLPEIFQTCTGGQYRAKL